VSVQPPNDNAGHHRRRRLRITFWRFEVLALTRDLWLSDRAFTLWIWLCFTVDDSHEWTGTLAEIVDDTRLTERSAPKAMKELEAKGRVAIPVPFHRGGRGTVRLLEPEKVLSEPWLVPADSREAEPEVPALSREPEAEVPAEFPRSSRALTAPDPRNRGNDQEKDASPWYAVKGTGSVQPQSVQPVVEASEEQREEEAPENARRADAENDEPPQRPSWPPLTPRPRPRPDEGGRTTDELMARVERLHATWSGVQPTNEPEPSQWDDEPF
jgi:hypothetical protein